MLFPTTFLMRTQQSPLFLSIPTFATANPREISCDVQNGTTYSRDLIVGVNWTVSGFMYCQYVSMENGSVDDFGEIMDNSSYVIDQRIPLDDGWHVLSFSILNQTEVVQKLQSL